MKRNMDQAMLFGVCSGIADSTGKDLAVIRCVFVALTLLGFGFPVLVYLVMALILPSE